MIGGYTVRAASEHISCAGCVAMLQEAIHSTLLTMGSSLFQYRGGLFHPSEELVKLLIGLRRFVDSVLPHRSLLNNAYRGLYVSSRAYRCCAVAKHRAPLRTTLLLIARKFIRPVLRWCFFFFSNFALGVADRNVAAKLLKRKPLSRKFSSCSRRFCMTMTGAMSPHI